MNLTQNEKDRLIILSFKERNNPIFELTANEKIELKKLKEISK